MPKKTFILLVFIMFLSMTGYGIVLPILPYFATDLGLSSFEMSSLITGWAFTQFLVLPFWGKIIDKFGRKSVLIFGLIGFGIAFILMMIAQNYWQLLLIRIIGAILSSGTQPAVLALVADSSDSRNRGKAMSNIMAANGIGFLLGPVIGSAIAPFGITMPFFVAGVLSLVTVPLAIVFIKEPINKTQLKQSPPLLSSIGYSFKRGYVSLFMITLGISIATSSILGVLGYYMIEQFQSSAIETGWAFTIQSGAAVFVQLFFISLLYRYLSEEKMTKYGTIITVLGFASIMITTHISFVFIGVFLIGAGQALIKPAVLASLSIKEDLGQGMVMSLHGTYDSLGRSIGPIVAGLLFSLNPIAPFLASFVLCVFLLFSISFKHLKVAKLFTKKGRGETI